MFHQKHILTRKYTGNLRQTLFLNRTYARARIFGLKFFKYLFFLILIYVLQFTSIFLHTNYLLKPCEYDDTILQLRENIADIPPSDDSNQISNRKFESFKRGENQIEDDLLHRDQVIKKFFKKPKTMKNVNCKRIFNGNDIGKYKRSFKFKTGNTSNDKPEEVQPEVLKPEEVKPEDYIDITRDCSSFVEKRRYITHHLTEEERNFPIAYSMLVYTNVEQAERLLRAIYRPQNTYCIHVDAKTDDNIFNALSHIGQCFDNVFVLNERINVTWGQMSVLEPELLCMATLWKKNKLWKYFINLTGQEFPLKTNYELVKILTAYNGSNDVEATIAE